VTMNDLARIAALFDHCAGPSGRPVLPKREAPGPPARLRGPSADTGATSFLLPAALSADKARPAEPTDQAPASAKTAGDTAAPLPVVTPPPDWAQPDFDDAPWPGQMGPFTAIAPVVAVSDGRVHGSPIPAKVRSLPAAGGYRGGADRPPQRQRRCSGRPCRPVSLALTATRGGLSHGAFFAGERSQQRKLLHSYNDRALTEQFALRERAAGRGRARVGPAKGRQRPQRRGHRSGISGRCRKGALGEFVPIGLTRLS